MIHCLSEGPRTSLPKGTHALRRLPALSIAVFALALPASASAQILPPGGGTPDPDPAPAPKPAAANMKIRLDSGVSHERKVYTPSNTLVRIRGRMNKAAAGETVTVEVFRKGKLRSHRNVRVGKRGRFATKVRVGVVGRYRIRAVHRRSKTVAAGTSNRVAISAIRARARMGARGPRVELLQKLLAKLGYAIPKTGRFDDATGRAVLAYRKVNRMRRISSANRTIFKRLFVGRGAFRLKYPKAGKHVEADLSRQVLVLAKKGKPWRVYHTSSGTSATPTVKGRFSFYRKEPGYNAKEMYYSSYFIRGYAIHGYKSVPTHPASHGCLRVPIPNAISIYRWISTGDPIFVYGKGRQPTRRQVPGP